MSAAAEVLQVSDEAKSEFLPLFEYGPLGVMRCDRHGKITAINPPLGKIIGRPVMTEESPCLTDLIHPDDRDEIRRLFTALLDRRSDSFQIEARAAGVDTPVRWTAWRVETVDGAGDGLLALVEEIPGTAVVNERLRQAQRLESVGRLASGVAHDFNNLLTGVLLYCDLLIASLEPAHRARKYAEEIRKAGLQATGVVRQLLAVSKPANCQPCPLSWNEIAVGMRNLLDRLIGDNIELKFGLDPQLGLVRMDPSQAQQILLNLVLNSRDAMPGGGTISLETGNCKVQIVTPSTLSSQEPVVLPCALFVVSDNGQGMDETTRARMFEPFFTTKGSKGTGLGMATVHDIVTTSGGLVYVDSKPGHGTRISVLLPLLEEESSQLLAEDSNFNNTEPPLSYHSKGITT